MAEHQVRLLTLALCGRMEPRPGNGPYHTRPRTGEVVPGDRSLDGMKGAEEITKGRFL